jgi:hypothetical protein
VKGDVIEDFILAVVFLIFIAIFIIYRYIKRIFEVIAFSRFVYDEFIERPTKEVTEIINKIKMEHNVEIIDTAVLIKITDAPTYRPSSGILYVDSKALVFEVLGVDENLKMTLIDKIVIVLKDIIEISKKDRFINVKTKDKTYSFHLSQPEKWESKLKECI